MIRVCGVEALQRDLDRLADTAQDLPVLGRIGSDITAAARGIARRRTGRMAAAIRPAVTPGRVAIAAGPERYMAVQHQGSARRGISPNRYLDKAFEQREEQAIQAIATEIDKHL